MSLLGFDDGSYLELISSMEAGQKDPVFWAEHIAGDGGPCAWAVYVEDIKAEAARISGLGVKVDGPHYKNRSRPDGQLVEWDLAFLGDKGAGATLPFIIKDITPRELRVRPSASVAGMTGRPAILTGVKAVILGVEHLSAALELFRHVYDWSSPQIEADPDFGARLAFFGSTPVIVATPLADHSWLKDRLGRFGESPCGFLLGTNDFDSARRQFGLKQQTEWNGRPVAWFDSNKLDGIRLGVMG
jgi:hypothetical protein